MHNRYNGKALRNASSHYTDYADKLQAISYDSSTKAYRILGEKVGQAFADGNALK